ncbi:unnamed protein product [Closterium sp. NIES-53]
MHVYGADCNKTYVPVSSYVTLMIFLSIIADLDLNLMQLDMKNAFPHSKLDRVLDVLGARLRRRATCSSLAMLKELLEAAFELREISQVEKYLGLEIVRDRTARKLCLSE